MNPSFLYDVFKLTRPFNAFIVVFALLVIRLILSQFFTPHHIPFQLGFIEFLVICVVGVFILAGGNVVNDIVDQEIDAINKPERVIVGKRIKNNTAWLIYHGLNFFALVLALWLTLKYGKFSYMSIPFLTIVLLMVYSYKLKKSTFWGNFVIAFLCAALTGVGFLTEINGIQRLSQIALSDYNSLILKAISMILFSFTLVLMREIVKDCQDLEGDRQYLGKTLAIKLGWDRTFHVINFLFFCYIVIFIVLAYLRVQNGDHGSITWAAGVYVIVLLVTFVPIMRKVKSIGLFKRLSTLIKFYLLLGLLFIML